MEGIQNEHTARTGAILIPGLVDSTTNYVEHLELIADRIVRYAELLDVANIVAGSDCGFSTFARSELTVHPSVTWAKLQARADGARLAAQKLWSFWPVGSALIRDVDGFDYGCGVDSISKHRPEFEDIILRRRAPTMAKTMTVRSDLTASANRLELQWRSLPRWRGITRGYSADEVVRLQGSLLVEYTLARRGSERLWDLLHTEDYVPTLGALSGNQAVQQVKAGLKAIYMSGWQVAADANVAGQMYPDQSLYPVNSVPEVVRRINAALRRADQIQHAEGSGDTDWFAPIVADAEAGFGGPLNAFELMKAMIEAGAAGVHFEDQLSSEKKCGHMGGKVLVPTRTMIATLTAARLAADVLGVPTILLARTDAHSAKLLTSDVDRYDQTFLTGERTSEGFYRVRDGIEAAIARGLAYAPYADLLWWETSEPDLEEAQQFADAIHARFPDKMLAYNCSPSFNWKRKLDDATIADFQRSLAKMGYRFQFITLAGFHSLNHSMFELAYAYQRTGMAAYANFQQAEFASEARGYSATRHQREVGAGYFDDVAMAISGGAASTTALRGSTEEDQFTSPVPVAVG